MKTHGELISINAISDAIIQIYNKQIYNSDNDDKIYDFVLRLQHHSTKCLWLDVCRKVLGNVDQRTVEKYQRKCKDMFKKHIISIISNIKKTKTRNVSPSVEYEQMEQSTSSDVTNNDFGDLDSLYNEVKKEETVIFPQNSIIADEHILSSTITDDHQSFHPDEQMIVDDSHNSSSIRSDQYHLRPKDYINDEITINEDIPLSNVSTTKNFESSSPNISFKKETDRKKLFCSSYTFLGRILGWRGKPLRKGCFQRGI